MQLSFNSSHICNPDGKDEELVEHLSEAAKLGQEQQLKLRKVATSRTQRLSEVEGYPHNSQLPSRGETDINE